MATGSGITWLAGDDATFEEALAVGADVRAAAVAAAARLPAKDLGRLYPSTMQDAVSIVHARLEENKRKAAASKQKSKSKAGAPHSPSDSHFRGARPGSGDPSAFWMYIEVGAEGECAADGRHGAPLAGPGDRRRRPLLSLALAATPCRHSPATPPHRTTSATSPATICAPCCRCCATHATTPPSRWVLAESG